ncbi:hypothetical protein JCM10207_006646 [Rhodosporidiobolus poonsookiae]
MTTPQQQAAMQQANQPQQQGGILSNPLVKPILTFLAIQAATSYFRGPPPAPAPAAPGVATTDGATTGAPTAQPTAGTRQQVTPMIPVWPAKTLVDVALKLSDEEDPLAVDLRDETYPGVTWEGLQWGTSGWDKVWELEWDVPKAVQNNGSFYLDVFMTRAGHSFIPSEPTYADGEVLHVRKPLTRYAPQRRVRAVHNLLSGKAETEEEEKKRKEEEEIEDKKIRPIVSFYHQNISLALVDATNPVPYENLPPPVKEHIHVARNGDKTFDGKQAYFPPLFANDFWLLQGHMHPINESTTRLPLRVELAPMSYFKFQLFTTMGDAFGKQSQSMGGGGGELDEVKRMLTETNPLLLITTAIVSVLHMLFEFLAFTADVKHWRGKQDNLVGVSVRTIILNVITQTIILLYLIDQSEETNYMIILSSGMGVIDLVCINSALCLRSAIEAWKVTKAVDISITPYPARPFLPYKLTIKDKHVLSEDEKTTQEADKLAFKWVAWAATPLLIGWTIYSLIYQPHRSWYSFTIQTLTSFVQAFGFVQLIPMLVVNYKLKSVAHIPMKAMGYKVLSTVIDDFFSFIIKMPLLHRLACFRDDVVFLILLYQMWIYPKDYKRENEYGQKLTDEEAEKLAKEQAVAGKAPKAVEAAPVKGKGKAAAKETKKTQ